MKIIITLRRYNEKDLSRAIQLAQDSHKMYRETLAPNRKLKFDNGRFEVHETATDTIVVKQVKE